MKASGSRGTSSCGSGTIVGLSLAVLVFLVSSSFCDWRGEASLFNHPAIVPHQEENILPHRVTCELSDEIVLTNEKVKRGPFSDVHQMERVHMMNVLLEKVTRNLNRAGICFWAERDTLLAAYRHGSSFPYSEQVDLAILASSFDRTIQALLLIQTDFGTIEVTADELKSISVEYTKLGLKATLKINSYAPTSNSRRLESPSSVFKPLVASVFPLKKALFNGEYIRVPANSERYLRGQFGPVIDQADRHFDWKTMSYVTDNNMEDNYPLVSVIIPTYGRPTFLKKSIEFINRQDYPNIEVIIVDDSPQATPEVIEAEDDHFHYYHLASRKSIGMKRNIAVEKAKGSIIVHWDDDDYFREHRITQQVAPIIRGDVDMTVLEHHLYLHLPTQSFYVVKRASTWGPHFATFVYNKKLWDDGLRYPDNSMAEDYAFAEAALKAGYKIDVLNNEDGKHIYVRHRNTWEFELEDYASQVQKVDRPAFFSEKDESFFLNLETKSLPKPPRHFASATIQWDRPELQPGWKTGFASPHYPPYYPPYYPKYPKYKDDDIFDATWIFVGVVAALPVVLVIVLAINYFYKKSRSDYTHIGEEGSLNSVA